MVGGSAQIVIQNFSILCIIQRFEKMSWSIRVSSILGRNNKCPRRKSGWKVEAVSPREAGQ
jgi:hypothetical protein